MANSSDNLEIKVILKGRPAEKSLDNLDRKTKKLGKTTAKSNNLMTSSWAKVGAAMAAVTVVLKKSIDAHAIQLKAEIALTNALRLNAKAGEASLKIWQDYASALQSVTIFGDEMTLQQIALLKTMQLTDKQTKEVIETAMDYATAFGKDMPSAVRELTMTLSGQIGTIKRTIPSIGDFTKAELKSGEAIKAVSRLMKGQAKALAATPWGKMKQQTNDFGDALEKLGEETLKLLDEGGALNVFTKIINGWSGIAKEIQNVSDVMAQANKNVSDIKKADEYLALLQQREALEAKIATITSDSWFATLRKNTALTALAKVNEKFAKKQAHDTELAAKEFDKLTVSIVKSKVELEEFKELKNLEITADDTAFTSIGKGVGKLKTTAVQDLQHIGDIATATANGMADVFTNMIMGTKLGFKDLARFVIAQLVRMAVMKMIIAPIAGFFGFHEGTTEVKHTGGIIGKHTGGAIGKANIPSFHNGMRSDERLAKLQVGEAVVNRMGARRNAGAIDAMNKGMPIGGGDSTVVHVTYSPQINALDPRTASAVIAANAPTIVGVIRQAFNRTGKNIGI